MKLRVNTELATKQKLSSTLRSWLPILQSDLESLQETLEPFVQENPFIEVKAGQEKVAPQYQKKSFFEQVSKDSVSTIIEALSVDKKSLYEVLYEQINPPLFPTQISQNIAYDILENIDHEGYFDVTMQRQIAEKNHCDIATVDKIRKRFAYLSPSGVGALDFKESFLFQLEELEVEDATYKLVCKIMENFEAVESFASDPNFNNALKILKKFKNPPAIDFMEENTLIIPDIFIFNTDGNIEVRLNDAYYPDILLDTTGLDDKEEFVSKKIKEAKDLIDALEMRKATLYKIGLLIVEYQYDFFFGSAIKPMKLKDLAVELGRNQSTISRAISGKYISCDRGVIPLKHFFATAVEENLSNSAIKDYMCELVKYEDRKKPLSDMKLLEAIEKKFGIKIVRRTITKYRQQFNIAGSSERKKLYALKCL
ncbi:RNA polymerase factor sigma-54 [Sulfurospirillum sp. 1612]|uniref:RNA polymerase factor sigma-54 n=1 Tax=Sulfurospirillum sp. 1612 TaxID=3094835 RepID=UPI002F91CC86